MAKNVLAVDDAAVDDARVMRDMVRIALTSAGFSVREACGGVEALRRGDPLDLIIADVKTCPAWAGRPSCAACAPGPAASGPPS